MQYQVQSLLSTTERFKPLYVLLYLFSLSEPNIHSSIQILRQHSLCPTKKRSRISFSINGKHDMFGNENRESSTPVSTKNPLFILNHEDSFVMIKPGLNKLSFIANVSLFVLFSNSFNYLYQ